MSRGPNCAVKKYPTHDLPRPTNQSRSCITLDTYSMASMASMATNRPIIIRNCNSTASWLFLLHHLWHVFLSRGGRRFPNRRAVPSRGQPVGVTTSRLLRLQSGAEPKVARSWSVLSVLELQLRTNDAAHDVFDDSDL